MYSTDRDFQNQSAKPVKPKNSPLRRRLTSRLQPLHGGLGFGANAIRERAMVVARQATLRRAVPNTANGVGSNARPALGPMGEGLQFTEEKTVVRAVDAMPELNEHDVPDSFVSKKLVLGDTGRRAAAAAVVPGDSSKRESLQLFASVSPVVPSIKSFMATPRRHRPPTLLQSLTAWIFDAMVVCICLVVGFAVSASIPFMGLLDRAFPALVRYSPDEALRVGSFGWMMLMMQTLTVASMLLFLAQALAGMIFAASIGRAIANVHMEGRQSVFLRGLKIGFGELLQWPLGFGLFNAVVSPEHNFFVRSLRWARGGSSE